MESTTSEQPTAPPAKSLTDAPADEATIVEPGGSSANSAVRAPQSALGMVRYFGDYELLEEIARGGMGVVYKARQTSLNRIVALKMILAGQLASEEAVKRFHAEAEAAASLDHPGIVPIFEVGEHEGQHYFSMGYVEGESLADRLNRSPLPPNDAAQLIKQIAEAVAYAHEKGVIHRDLKPGNVLLEPSNSQSQLPRPRITDFGLAKRIETDSRLTATGQILGTPSYMPPEQASGTTQEITATADVYALGAILYACLTGRPPFQAHNPVDTIIQVVHKEPPGVRHLNSAVAKDLETICAKCLQKEPEKRYPSAYELRNELTRYLCGKPILARPVGRIERAGRWCRRNPAVAMLLAAVSASLIIGLVATLWQWRRAETNLEDLRISRAAEERYHRQVRRHLYNSNMNVGFSNRRQGNAIRTGSHVHRHLDCVYSRRETRRVWRRS